jgi:phage shock protein PspC (stress-responsive transcriptional regulator)
MEKKLYRSRTTRVISGVCGGLADYLNMPVGLTRALFIVILIFSGGMGFFLYLFMSIFIPEEPSGFGREIETPVEPAANYTVNAPKGPARPEFVKPPESPKGPQEGEAGFDFEKTYKEFIDGSGMSPGQIEPVKAAFKTIGVVVSLCFALVMISIGIYLIFPGLIWLFRKAGSVILAFLLVLFALQMMITTVSRRVYSFLIYSVGAVLLTLAVFVAMTGFDLISYHVFGVYVRILIPVGIIALGVKFVAQALEKKANVKPAGILILSIMFVFFGFYSVDQVRAMEPGIKSGDLQGEFRKIFNPPQTADNKSYYSYQMPDSPVTGIVYRIENYAGDITLGIGSSDERIEYKSAGTTPQIADNLNGMVWTWVYKNMTGSSSINMIPNKTCDIDLKNMSGEIKGDLSGLPLRNADIEVKSGSCKVKLGKDAVDIKVKVLSGESVIELPRNSDITVYYTSGSHGLVLPGGFSETAEGAMKYNGSGNKVKLYAESAAGSIRIELY